MILPHKSSGRTALLAITLFANLMGVAEGAGRKTLGVCTVNNRHLSILKIKAKEGTNTLKKAWNRLRGKKHIDSRMPHVEFVLGEGEKRFTSYFSRGRQPLLEAAKSGEALALLGGPARLPSQKMQCRINKRGDERRVIRKLMARIGAIGYLDGGEWRFLQPDYSEGDTVSVKRVNARSEESAGTIHFRRGETAVTMIDDKTVSAQSTDHIMYKLKFAHSEAASRFYHAIHAITEDDVFSHSSTRTQIGGGNSPSTNDQEALNPSDDEVSEVERLLK